MMPKLDSEGKIQGDPTEVALFKVARHAGYEPELVRAAAPPYIRTPLRCRAQNDDDAA